jgi:purine-nucleoside phosphorylase
MSETAVYPTRHQLEQAAAYIRDRATLQPAIGLILGSGLSSLADQVEQAVVLPYDDIPHFAATTVHGHTGRAIVGSLEGHPVLVMQGRFHFYEGHTMQRVTFPVRVMRLLQVQTLIVTNAAGGLAPHFAPGDLMLISDHINMVGMGGQNPLIGSNDPELGPRFPDMSQPYDPGLRRIARQVAKTQDIPLQEGVYVSLAGPSFETPAEIRFLRLIGADAVGMSTVPEVIVARHMGMRVLGISGISNVHAADAERPQETTHTEVLETGRIIAPRLMALVRGVLRQL